jgi:LemA protein
MEWVIGALILVGLVGVWLYNRLVSFRNRVTNAFAQIDVQLHRRHDLIPNLVEVARKYMSHERDTLEAVIRARNSAVDGLREAAAHPEDPDAIRRLGQAEQGLSGALGRLFALSEAYPDLKANQNMMQLSEELTSTENRVAFARQGFNDAVMVYNIAREQFPGNIVASMFSFTAAAPLEIDDPVKREAPRVTFG